MIDLGVAMWQTSGDMHTFQVFGLRLQIQNLISVFVAGARTIPCFEGE
jgi:hypothetical protein